MISIPEIYKSLKHTKFIPEILCFEQVHAWEMWGLK